MGEFGDSLSANLILRGVEYTLTFTVQEEALEVEVEDVTSGEEWRGRFSAEYLEEMTHKTGNFKKFDVFVDMFRTVLTEPIDSLSIDLMTFHDLQELRRQKKGGGGHARRSARNETNRYLILVYTAPYDRIYYPLTLHYAGRPDPAQLKATIAELRTELRQGGTSRELRHLRQETRRLRAENEELREAAAAAAAAVRAVPDSGTEVRALQAVVAGLEEDLAAERARVQRLQQKLQRERAQLREEAEEARAGERLLKVRARTLVNELALHRRERLRPGSGYSNSGRGHSGGSSPASSVRSVPVGSPRSFLTGRPREAPNSARPPAGRPSSDGSMDRLRRARARSASPRFDPTAFVEERRRKRMEAEERHTREIRARLSGGSLGSSRSVSPAGSRAGSASSSLGRRSGGSGRRVAMLSSEEEDSDSSASVSARGSHRGRRPRQPSSINSTPRDDPLPARTSRPRIRAAPVATKRPLRQQAKPAAGGGFGGTYQLEEMRDIDERINRLNQFLTQVIQERA